MTIPFVRNADQKVKTQRGVWSKPNYNCNHPCIPQLLGVLIVVYDKPLQNQASFCHFLWILIDILSNVIADPKVP